MSDPNESLTELLDSDTTEETREIERLLHSTLSDEQEEIKEKLLITLDKINAKATRQKQLLLEMIVKNNRRNNIVEFLKSLPKWLQVILVLLSMVLGFFLLFFTAHLISPKSTESAVKLVTDLVMHLGNAIRGQNIQG